MLGQHHLRIQKHVDKNMHSGPRPLAARAVPIGQSVTTFHRHDQVIPSPVEYVPSPLLVIGQERLQLLECVLPIDRRLLILEVEEQPKLEAGI